MTITDMVEKDWQRQVIDLAKTLGYRRPMHIYDSRRSEPGWPDLTLINTRLGRFVLLELKTETGKVSQAQAHWMRDLAHVGVEVYLVRPRHLDMLAVVLQARGAPHLIDVTGYTKDGLKEIRDPVWNRDQSEALAHLLLERDSLLAKYDIPY